jgi:hypothetical protein
VCCCVVGVPSSCVVAFVQDRHSISAEDDDDDANEHPLVHEEKQVRSTSIVDRFFFCSQQLHREALTDVWFVLCIYVRSREFDDIADDHVRDLDAGRTVSCVDVARCRPRRRQRHADQRSQLVTGIRIDDARVMMIRWMMRDCCKSYNGCDDDNI